MKAIAYYHGPDRILRLAKAFAEGCKHLGIPCELRHIDRLSNTRADVVWVYGLGPAQVAFDAHPEAVRIVGDKGYFHEAALVDKYFRISVDGQQPTAQHLIAGNSPERWNSLGIKTKPVAERGDYVLLCGMGPKQATRQNYAYGEWEREAYRRLQQNTDRQILVREKPKNPPIQFVESSSHKTTGEAIRGAWCVVCNTGNIGVDAILHGVPVIADGGPGAIYYSEKRVDIIAPITDEERLQALSDIAYWQWAHAEIADGAMLSHLMKRGIV